MRRIAIALVTTVALVGCGEEADTGGAAGPQGDQPRIGTCTDAGEGTVVVATDNAWDPACVRVAAGQDLTVRNDGNAAHTFTLPEADINLVLQPGDEATAEGVGDAVGPGEELQFVCDFHPEMVGIVQGAES